MYRGRWITIHFKTNEELGAVYRLLAQLKKVRLINSFDIHEDTAVLSVSPEDYETVADSLHHLCQQYRRISWIGEYAVE